MTILKHLKGGIFIPNIDFISTLLNIAPSDIATSNVRNENGIVYYEITLVRKPIACPLCGSPMIGHGHKLKTINHPVLRNQHGVILYNANRYICKSCNKTAFERNPFAFEGFNSSFLLLQNTMKYLQNLNYTLKMISEELNISTTQINKYLDSYVVIPPRKLPECLGIDEIYSKSLSKRNSSYLCVLVDNVNRSVYDVLDSRSKDSLSSYFSEFSKDERNNVKYVTIDMWDPYKDIAAKFFPQAIVAIDPFHVISHLTKGFDRLRLDLMNQCEYNSNAYYLLKKWNWLLKTDDVFWDNERVYNHHFKRRLNRRDLLEMIQDTFPLLSYAYELKESYRMFNRNCSYLEACERFPSIAARFKNSGIKQYSEFSSILYTWENEILNSFKRPYNDRKLTNAYTENVNGKIKTYLSISNGINNFPRFRKRVIFALSNCIYYSLSKDLHNNNRQGKKRGPYNKAHD